MLSANKDLPFAAFAATKVFEYITLKLQYHLTVSTPNPLLLDTLLHDISPLLRVFFDLENLIKSHNPLENNFSVELKCTKNLFRHFLGYIGSKENLETQDHLLLDLLRAIINPHSGFTSTLSEAQLISVIEEDISEFKPSIYLALSRIFQFLDKKAIVRLCNDPMELIKGILDSIDDVESPIFHEIVRFLYSVHLNSQVQTVLERSGIHIILYKLLQMPYQDFYSPNIPETFHKTRLLCIQIIIDCVSVQSESDIAKFVRGLVRSDAKYLADDKTQLFIDQIMKPLLKIAPLSRLIPVSVCYQPPLMNQELFKSLSKEVKEEETSCPSLLTQDQYEKLLGHIYTACINDDKLELHDKDAELEKSRVNCNQLEMKWKWRTINGSLNNALQSESCLLIFPCTFLGGESIKIGFYLASPQVNGKADLRSLRNCMFYIFEGQLQFLSSQLHVEIELKDEELDFTASICSQSDFFPVPVNSKNQMLRPTVFKYSSKSKVYSVFPQNMCKLDLSPEKGIWKRFQVESKHRYEPHPPEVCSGYPFYDINNLQPSYSVNITTELIENSTSSHIVYLVPKNLSLQTFAQVLLQDSPDAIKFLQIESNNKVLKPATKIDESFAVLTISSSFMEAEVLKHLSASPCQVLQRILNQHPDQVPHPLLKPLNDSIQDTLHHFEELGRTIKTKNPNLLKKFASLLHQYGAFINAFQMIIGDSLISLILDFLLEGPTSAKFIRVLSMTVLSHLKFRDTLSVTPGQLFQALSGILTSLINVSNQPIKTESDYLKNLLSHLNTASSQIFFLSDPRVFQSFMNAILWRTMKDINQLSSLLSYDNNLFAFELTKNQRIIQEEKEIWGEVLLMDPQGIKIERLRAYQILERWTLIFEKLHEKTKSQNLALQVLKILKLCVYESLTKIRPHSKDLFNAFDKLCNEKSIENPYSFFKETLNNISMLVWTKSIAQEYLGLQFEAFDYTLLHEIMTLPLIGFKFLKSILLKDFNTDEGKKTLEIHKINILPCVHFLQKLGSYEFFKDKLRHYDVDEFYEQWTATIISLNIPKVFMKLLCSLKDQLFLEVLGKQWRFSSPPKLF